VVGNDWCPIGVPMLSHLIKKPIQTDPELTGRFWRPKPFQIVSVARIDLLSTCGGMSSSSWNFLFRPLFGASWILAANYNPTLVKRRN
jgi:hypothetical protein